MAAITPTISTYSPSGEHVVLTGSFTGVAGDSHIALVGTNGYVHSFNVSAPTEDAATPKVVLNKTTGGTASNGSVQVQTTGIGVYTFEARVNGAW